MNMYKMAWQATLGFTFLARVRRVLSKPAPAKPEVNSNTFDALDRYIEDQMRHLKIPGAALAVVEGEKIVHKRGFGKARPGGETPTPQTPFFIGSLTKSLTALAVKQLEEVGKVELDAPVQRYLPWFRVANAEVSARITVRHLLNQTSGLPMLPGLSNLANFDNRPDVMERQARALSTLALRRLPGAKFEYSNLNYNLLGLVIEAASGEKYAGYIRRHIFDPLKMSHSYTSRETAQRNGLAVGHRHWFGIPIAVNNLPVASGSIASGQLISTAEDMCRYLSANLNQGRYGGAQILSGAGIDELHRPAAEIREMGLSLGAYGMGWISEGAGEARIVSHGGTMPDFGAFMAVLPEQHKGMILLLNANHVMIKLALDELGFGAAQRLGGQKPTPTQFWAAPWVERAQLIIPALQFIDVITTLRLLRRWREEPPALAPAAGIPQRSRSWGQKILLPLIPNLSVSLALIPMLGKLGGFLRVFAPDTAWMAIICGSFGLMWSLLRTGLILWAAKKAKGTP